MPGLTLDASALIAFERNDRHLVSLMARAIERGHTFAVPAGAVGQVWRDGRRQARLARLLGSEKVEIESLDDRRARDAGQCAASRARPTSSTRRWCCAPALIVIGSLRPILRTSDDWTRALH